MLRSSFFLSEQDPRFGTVHYAYSRGRMLRATIKAHDLYVYLPVGMPIEQVRAFLTAKESIIRRKQQRQEGRHRTVFLSEEQPLQTLTFAVKLTANPMRSDVFCRFADGHLHIEYPARADLQQLQPVFWNMITHFLNKEARRILPSRVDRLAEQNAFRYTTVKIGKSRGRWGSCSTKGNINLSYYLLLAPQYLVDYVILHELCHTIEMNHGPRFWALLDRCTHGRAKELRKELQQIVIPV